jgi:hypothetical protein
MCLPAYAEERAARPSGTGLRHRIEDPKPQEPASWRAAQVLLQQPPSTLCCCDVQDDLRGGDDGMWDDDMFGGTRISSRTLRGGDRWGGLRGFDSTDDDF